MAFWKTVAVLGVALSAASWAQAKDINYNIIQLSDSAQMNVPQNQLNVTLVVESTAANRNDASRVFQLYYSHTRFARLQSGCATGLSGRLVRLPPSPD